MSDSIRIEKVKNGFEISIYKEPKEDTSSEGPSMMYPEPEEYVATSGEEALKFVKKFLGIKG